MTTRAPNYYPRFFEKVSWAHLFIKSLEKISPEMNQMNQTKYYRSKILRNPLENLRKKIRAKLVRQEKIMQTSDLKKNIRAPRYFHPPPVISNGKIQLRPPTRTFFLIRTAGTRDEPLRTSAREAS